MKDYIDISGYISRVDFGVEKLSKHIEDNPELVSHFIEYISSNTKEAWRASWVMAYYSSKHPDEISPYADKIINALKAIKIDGHIRETLKILLNLRLTEEQESEVFDICLNILQNNHIKPSVRSIAFQFLLKISENYPELKNEILIIFENIKDFLSHGIRHSMGIRIK